MNTYAMTQNFIFSKILGFRKNLDEEHTSEYRQRKECHNNKMH